MNRVRATIPGDPRGKERPRHTSGGHTYTPEKTREYEKLVKLEFLRQVGKASPLEGPVEADVTAYYRIPKSVSKKKREAMLRGEVRPTGKPDLDNIAKAVLDSLNGIAYRDDAQVTELRIRKYYSEEPRVELSILECESNGVSQEGGG